MAKVSEINVYPIKSASGISLSDTWVDELGLSFDRRFVVTTPEGNFITARTHHHLCLIKCLLTANGLKLIAPDMPVLTINYRDFDQNYHPVTVWNDTINAQHCHARYDAWFSQYLNQPCQLMYFGERSTRSVKNSTNQVSFADGYPLLITSEASLIDLNGRSYHKTSMNQFRANIVVEDCEAFAEDTWSRIRIGEVEFDVVKPCTRCIFTTINPQTGEKHHKQEPLHSLKKYRQLDNGDVCFGQNIVPLNQGKISLSDPVEIISKQSPPVFVTKKPNNSNSEQNKTVAKKGSNNVDILFDSWDKFVKGNSKETLLEQGETAGLIMPYSCRGGMCGRCKVKLQSGEVRQLATDGLSPQEQEQGYVLACSSVPLTDVVITKD
ncbi:MOSC domain-containing protein [Thalassotalea sp. LPB0316]|uniref:YcbX family protein n=1 Tax=Thalassotalea sp. LPB0316 TaxID=2769490 RepID=UPI001865D855|nr:YcbX family protein [Thalassotalea sp. LPB0316]QOL26081.1 MOSC domain-containing protein [Thalassotalea sp. LPB0316]